MMESQPDFDSVPIQRGILEEAAQKRCQLIQSMARKEDVNTKQLDRLADQMFNAGVPNSKRSRTPSAAVTPSATPSVLPVSHSSLTSAQYRVSSKAILLEHPHLGVLRTVEPPLNFNSRNKTDQTYQILCLNLQQQNESHNIAPQNSPVSAESNPILSQLRSPSSQKSSLSHSSSGDDPKNHAKGSYSDWLEQKSPPLSRSSSELSSSVEDMSYCLKSVGNINVEIGHHSNLGSRGSKYVKQKRYVEMYIPRVEQDTDAEASREKIRPHVVVSEYATDEKEKVEDDQDDRAELDYQKTYDWDERRPRPDRHLMKLEALLSPLKMSPNISELAVAFEPPSPDSSHVSFSPKKTSNQFSSTFKLMKEIYSPQLMSSSNSSLLTSRGHKIQTKEVKRAQSSQAKVPENLQTSRQKTSNDLSSMSKISIASLTFFEDLKPSEKFGQETDEGPENILSPISTKVIKGKKKVRYDEKTSILSRTKEKTYQSKQQENSSNKPNEKNERNTLTTITFGSKEAPNEIEFSTTTKHYSEPKHTNLDHSRYLRTGRGGPDYRTQYISFTSPKPQIETPTLQTADGRSTQRSCLSSNALAPFKNKRIKSAPVNSRLKLHTMSNNSISEKSGELGSLILLPSNEESQTKNLSVPPEKDSNRIINSARPFRKIQK